MFLQRPREGPLSTHKIGPKPLEPLPSPAQPNSPSLCLFWHARVPSQEVIANQSSGPRPGLEDTAMLGNHNVQGPLRTTPSSAGGPHGTSDCTRVWDICSRLLSLFQPLSLVSNAARFCSMPRDDPQPSQAPAPEWQFVSE